MPATEIQTTSTPLLPFALELAHVRGGDLGHGDNRSLLCRGFSSYKPPSDLESLLGIGRRRLVHGAVNEPGTDRLDTILAATRTQHFYRRPLARGPYSLARRSRG